MRTRFGMRARNATSRFTGVAAFSLLAVAFAFPVQALAAMPVPQAPTVVTPTDGAATTSRRPLITGVAVNGSRVAVLLDGQFHGFATVVDDPSGTAHFAFTPSLALLPGEHELRVRAESRETSHWGGTSSPTTFVVQAPVPAPSLLDTVQTASANRPVVRGLAHTDTVKVYVDGKFDGRAAVKDHENGVGNFAYTPSRSLSSGTHKVEVRAVDTRGRESVLSSALAVAVPTAEAATTETEGGETTGEAASTSSDEPTATTDETAAEPEETEDEVVAGDTDQSEESGDSEESDDTADDTAENSNTNESATDSEDEDEDGVNRSVVTWVIVLAVLIILAVLRFRGGGDGGMGGGSPFRPGPRGTGGTPTGTGSGTGSPGTGQKNDSMPNPPPPSSNY